MSTEKAQQISYKESLEMAGLSPEEATVYEILLQNGPLPAGKIHQKSPYKRGLVYKILADLEKLSLVIKKDEPGKVAVFEPGHPLRLKELAETKEKQAKQAQSVLEGVISDLTSTYNLVAGKPGIQFFEGPEGVKKVIYDNLSTSGEILAYLDQEHIMKYMPDLNEEYLKVRRRLKIKKRNLVLDTPENRKLLANYNRDITDVRMFPIEAGDEPFKILMQIYDDKISYVTLTPEYSLGAIIQNPAIADMHRKIYEFNWSKASPI